MAERRPKDVPPIEEADRFFDPREWKGGWTVGMPAGSFETNAGPFVRMISFWTENGLAISKQHPG